MNNTGRRMKGVFGVSVVGAVIIAIFTVKIMFEKDTSISYQTFPDNRAEVCGDILDYNGKKIVTVKSTDSKETFIFKDADAYCIFLGWSNGKKEDVHSGLFRKYYKELYDGEEKGATIQLTLDCDLQEYAYKILKKRHTKNASSVVIMDAKTGAIKACTFTPAFNYNTREWDSEINAEEDSENPLVYKMRVPGSIFKIVDTVGILEAGLENNIVTDEGVLYLNGNDKIKNFAGNAYGKVSLKEAFSYSSNVYFGTMVREYLKKEKLDELAERFLLGKRLELDFGNIQSRYSTTDNVSELCRTAIGQGKVEMNIINAAMLANVAVDGNIMKPYVVKRIYNEKESLKQNNKTGEVYKKVTTKKVAGQLREIMQYTGENLIKRKTGAKTIQAGGKNISIGLKTGTGEINNEKKLNSSWITSFAPADNPQYIIAINVYGTEETGGELLPDIIDLYKKAFSIKNE